MKHKSNLTLWFFLLIIGQFHFVEGFSKPCLTLDIQSCSPESQSEECDNIKYIAQASKPEINSMLAGVRYAVITNTDEDIRNFPSVFQALYKYLTAMNFEMVEYMDANYKSPSHYCEEIFVSIDFLHDRIGWQNLELNFESPCNENYSWSLKTNKIVRDNPSIVSSLYNAIREMYPHQKPTFNARWRIELPEKQTCWTETKLKDYIQLNGCDKIEGIYENVASSDNMAKYKLAVRKINGTYYLLYLSGADNSGNWTEGEVKATLEPTATPLFFKAKWLMAGKTENNNYYLTFEQGLFNLFADDNGKSLYIKMFPSASDKFRNNPPDIVGSGTGYALSANGHIVTNYHVTNGATSIKVRGVNGNFSKSYNATVLVDDKNNDLSIIKIDDPSFTSLGAIPYIISSRSIDVGSSVFVLGYPLRVTMGDEVKLTNGIVSSKSGFQGDITSYQISAPVQPGNSGGPLFDDKGNVIGTINAKHTGAESVSYAIKTSYLLSLIESLPSPPKLQTISSVSGKPLTEQVKLLKKFTYIIEIN